MEPKLANGDYVICTTWFKHPKPGVLLVADHPAYGTIIKRVARVFSDGSCYLASNSKSGVSEADLGPLAPKQIIGQVVLTIKAQRRVPF